MEWWHWIVIGLALTGLEMLAAGTFFILFFGVGALVVGLLSLLRLGGPQWLQWLLFSLFSVASLLLFREPLLRRVRATLSQPDRVDTLTGEVAVVLDDIPSGAVGRAELRGATWSATNVGHGTLVKGSRCRVVALDGLMLSIVQHEEGE